MENKKENKLAPICLFVYTRLEETKKTINALKENILAKESELFIFSDGAKNKETQDKIQEIRNYLRSINGFKRITIIESEINKGLAQSIIEGVSSIIEKYKKVIVLEDDLITTPNFLTFMNDALHFYENSQEIFSISGYTLDLPTLKNYNKDYYLGLRASSWGWGTWENRWKDIDWEIKDYNKFKWNIVRNYKFSRGGSDMPSMLKKQMKGKIDSWAIRWCYNQYKKGTYTVFASKSKVKSIGFGENATHTFKEGRFGTMLDKSNQVNFIFEKNPEPNTTIIKEFRNKFSILSRIKYKINNK